MVHELCELLRHGPLQRVGDQPVRRRGDYDYCANKYNRYTADKIDRYDFRGNVGIVLMDFAAASHATMTYGQTYSNMQVYGDDLVRAVICNNNKWNLRRNE